MGISTKKLAIRSRFIDVSDSIWSLNKQNNTKYFMYRVVLPRKFLIKPRTLDTSGFILGLLIATLEPNNPAKTEQICSKSVYFIRFVIREKSNMTTLTVWKFPTADGAERTLAKLADLKKQELIEIEDAAIVTWPFDTPRSKGTRSVKS